MLDRSRGRSQMKRDTLVIQVGVGCETNNLTPRKLNCSETRGPQNREEWRQSVQRPKIILSCSAEGREGGREGGKGREGVGVRKKGRKEFP
jgi:hypothetical protein